ncbi:MAG: ABC transporter ATP-binding protein [Nanoarchaeota archaeon]|nr:ABC transporter ATP-binding protein [Nanoarchaeota archaeon]
MSAIELRKVCKKFEQANKQLRNLRVLDNISLKAKKGEFIAVFGPNGCGKTTLLNIIAGIEKSSSGSVRIDGKCPALAKVGFVFQNYNESMLPWRTALGNIELAMEGQKISKKDRMRIAEHYLKKVGLSRHKNKYFYELSGGMKQLIAICRAFAYDPDILLMDEPFSSLDYSTTRKMELELLNVWRETAKTTIFVSHDIDEAVFLADKVIVFSKRPARVKGIIEIDLPRPRKLEMLSSKAFIRIRNKMLRLSEYET